jgi:hypothetical protein
MILPCVHIQHTSLHKYLTLEALSPVNGDKIQVERRGKILV